MGKFAARTSPANFSNDPLSRTETTTGLAPQSRPNLKTDNTSLIPASISPAANCFRARSSAARLRKCAVSKCCNSVNGPRSLSSCQSHCATVRARSSSCNAPSYCETIAATSAVTGAETEAVASLTAFRCSSVRRGIRENAWQWMTGTFPTAVEPCRKATSAIKAANRTPSLEQSFLNDIFCELPVSRQCDRAAKQRLGVHLGKRLKRPLISGLSKANKFAVRVCAARGHTGDSLAATKWFTAIARNLKLPSSQPVECCVSLSETPAL